MWEDIKEIILPVIFVMILATLVVSIPVIIVDYYSSCREAKIFNAQNQTNYTCSDFFWAQTQINQQIQTIKLQGLEK